MSSILKLELKALIVLLKDIGKRILAQVSTNWHSPKNGII